MLKKPVLLFAALCFAFTLNAQDTLRVMCYNLLYYGEYVFGCNANNNNPDNKDIYLRSILEYDQPDIFVVNEISSNAYYHQRILDSVLHKIPGLQYARAGSQKISNSNIMNMLYYNTEKLALRSQHIMQSNTRDINLYSLYYKSPDLVYGDTAFIHCIGAHLKAGSSDEDQQRRRDQVNNVMAWLQNNGQQGNFLFMGDLNVKTVEEPSMQALLYGSDISFRFYDPADQLGEWNNNVNFTMYHTQSTHTYSSGGCHSTGGLDDRFDFILASADIMEGNQKVSYIENSYRSMGQDGQHLNRALIDSPANLSAPVEVLQALYLNSDHLPVLLSLAVDQSPASNRLPFHAGIRFTYNNPVSGQLIIQHSSLEPGLPYSLNIFSLIGNRHISINNTTGNHPIKADISHLPNGFYLAELKIQEFSKIIKIVKI